MLKLIMNLKSRFIYPLRSKRAAISNTAMLLFFMFIACIIAYMYVDVYGYWSQRQKIVIGVNEQLEVIKAENGFDSSNQQTFNRFMLAQGIDPKRIIIVEATPKTVQKGTPVRFSVRMNYETIALKPFGRTLTLPITVTAEGLASTKLRGG